LKAVLCPVCNGSGKYSIPPTPGSTLSYGYEVTCHGCLGKGWVEVHQDPYYDYPAITRSGVNITISPDNTTISQNN